MDRAPITAAVLEGLRDLGPWPVGDGVAPRPEKGQATAPMPYLVLYEVDGGGFDGPVYFDPHADATLIYQVTAVGERRDQVRALMDRVHGFFVGRDDTGALAPIEPEGYKVVDRSVDGGSGGIDREGLIFSGAERFAVSVTPL